MSTIISQMGRRGTLVIPAALRKQFGLQDGSSVIAEARDEGVLIRPVSVSPVEIYSDTRKAGFLLNNAVSEQDYCEAVEAVKAMGLDPADIPHYRPEPR
jgi:AbrB family looped-hinge helix DNA binding protein